MQIWSPEIKELESLSTSFKDRFPELEKDLNQLIKTEDENVALLYSRRCLEIIVTDLCESELKRPRGTEPLRSIIDKLNKEKKVPSHIITSMLGVNDLSTYGTHPKEFDPEQVKPVINNLTIIFKWYIKYKGTPIIRQEETGEVKHKGKQTAEIGRVKKKSKKKLIFLMAGILLVAMIVIVALFAFNFVGDKKEIHKLEKSIAVLPFVNDSKDEENEYFINGIMEEVLLNLQTIKDLRVPGRTSVEKYRNSNLSISEIASELGVNYIVEGSGQKYGNSIRLRVQLLEGVKDRHLWGESYEKIIEKPEDIFKIQSQIAQSIAMELNAIISPVEKQLIEKTYTTSLTAYDFYHRGREEYQKYLSDNNEKVLEKAEDFYNEALVYDSTFARAYTGLAEIYWDKHYSDEFFSSSFMDSALILVDIALSYDDQLPEGYNFKGYYYYETGKFDLAIQAYDRALKFNPNYWEAYLGKGRLYLFQAEEMDQAIQNLFQASLLHRGVQLPMLLRNIALALQWVGFIEQADTYIQEALKLDGDSAKCFSDMGRSERYLGNYLKAIELNKKAYTLDTNNLQAMLALGEDYAIVDQKGESLKYMIRYIERLKALGGIQINAMHRIGYAYWVNGYTKEGKYYFDEQIRYCKESIKLNRHNSQNLYVYYDLAAVYAFRGETKHAIENLRIFNQRKKMPIWAAVLINHDPLFNNIRNEPEFQQIVRDVEAKYQAEHERVRKWLEEQGML
jgi:TolB-like protein/Tfp pilus assembly protein PilF